MDRSVPGGVLGAKRERKVILIGPDCSGKSTVAEYLAQQYGVLPIGNRRINDDMEAALHVLNFVNTSVRKDDAPFVLDQFMYPVDIVYNKVLRDSESVMTKVEPLIVKHLVEQDVLFLHVDADSKTITERFEQRGDELWDLEQILKVAQAYRTYFKTKRHLLHYMHLDTSELTKAQACKAAHILVETFYTWEESK
jgi:cytidylate kinase